MDKKKMKRQRSSSQLRVVVVLVCSLFTVHGLLFAEGELKIGYVNLGRIFDGYQRTKDSEEILEQKGKQKQTELENRVNELTKLRQDVELSSDKARDSKTREIEEKSDFLQQLKTKSQRELVRERNQAAKQILDEIEQSVSEYAKTNGFSVILDQRSLLYGQDAYDITDKVLRMLNDRYAATAKKAKHPN